MFLRAYDQPKIRQYLISQGLIDAAGNVLDAHGVWVAAYHYGVTGPQLDAAIPLPPGTADAYVRDAGLQALRGVDYSTESGNPAAYAPPPPTAYTPPPVVVTNIPPVNASLPYVAPNPVLQTPVANIPAANPVNTPPNYLFDPNTPATVTITPTAQGVTGSITQNAILWGGAALAALMLLKKRG